MSPTTMNSPQSTALRRFRRRCNYIPGLALVLAALGLSQPGAQAANGPPLYFDVSGDTPGFGSPSGSYNLWGDDPGALWSTDSTGSSASAIYNPYGSNGLPLSFATSQWTFGAVGTDLADSTFTISAWYMSRPICGLVINSTSANITLDGYNYNTLGSSQTWFVAAGSTFTEATGAPDRGLNCDNKALTLTGGGTINFNSHIGFNSWSGDNGKISEDGAGLVVNLKVNQADSVSPFGAGFTLTNGTLNFAAASAYDAFIGFTSSAKPFAINGGILDNTSGNDMTLEVGAGGYSIGGNFTFTGSCNLNLGTAPVVLTVTPQLNVGASTLAIDGSISGSGFGLTKTGNGTLLINGVNTYDGLTTVSAGTFGGTGTLTGAATFAAGSKAVFSVTPDGSGNNSTAMTVAGVMSFNANEVHLNLPANLPPGTYVLATSSATPEATGAFPTPVVDSGSFAFYVTGATISVDSVNKQLVLTVVTTITGPVQLAITQVNGGTNPIAGTPFDVVVQAQSGSGVAKPVSANTAVTLSIKNGTGTLVGTLSGSILTGQSQVTIHGVIYSPAQNDVVLEATVASGDSLVAGDSAAITVIAIPNLTIGEEQFNNSGADPSPIVVAADDLLQMSGVTLTISGEGTDRWSAFPSLLTDGFFENPPGVGGDPYNNFPVTMTYALNLTSNPVGYDIKEIRMFSQPGQYRAGQSYDILYSLVGEPDTYILLGTVLTPTTEWGALMTRTYNSMAGATADAGAAILSGVAKIRFNLRPCAGQDGGVVWREFDVTGTPSPIGTAVATTTLGRSASTGTDTGAGDSLSFDVSVSGATGTPTGAVTLKDGGTSGTVLGSATLAGGTCTITTTTLSAGTHDNIVAVYEGNLIYAVSASSALTPAQTVTINLPPNDNFADAIALPGNSGSRTGSRTLYASFETGEPQCGYPTTINTVWFKWTCISTGTFTISTLGSRNGNGTEWDAVLGIYTGTTLADLALVPDLYCPANDYNNTPGPSSNPQDTGSYETTQFAVTAGATYYFQMGGDGGGGPNFPDDALNIVLNWSFIGSGGGNTYADWVGADGGTADQDSNHDGVPNGIAYFMGEHGLITLPGVDTNNTITWKMNATFSGTYEIQTSTDLKTWTSVAAQPTPADGNLSYTLPKAAEAGKLFVRLAVSPN